MLETKLTKCKKIMATDANICYTVAKSRKAEAKSKLAKHWLNLQSAKRAKRNKTVATISLLLRTVTLVKK